MFPLKQKCLNALYKMIAWAYIDTRNLMRLTDEETRMRYLKHHLRVNTTRLPRQRELAWVKISTRKNMLKMFRRRLSVASEPMELAWLFHDFSKFLIEISRFDLARYYAKKSRDSAIEAQCEQWILNASHMMMLVEICQNNRNEAKEAAANAIVSAKKLGIDYLVRLTYIFPPPPSLPLSLSLSLSSLYPLHSIRLFVAILVLTEFLG